MTCALPTPDGLATLSRLRCGIFAFDGRRESLPLHLWLRICTIGWLNVWPLLKCGERADLLPFSLSLSFLSFWLYLSVFIYQSVSLPPFPAHSPSLSLSLPLSLFFCCILPLIHSYTHQHLITSPSFPPLPTDLSNASHAPHAREGTHPPYAASLVPYSGHCTAQRYGCPSGPRHSILPPPPLSPQLSRTRVICCQMFL